MQYSILVLIFLSSFRAMSHGEEKPGPHGGNITMPGAYHVELVQVDSKILKAYLLDMNLKESPMNESSIDVTIGMVSAKCITENDYFICNFPTSVDLNKSGELVVKSMRNKQKGKTVKYLLPLKFPKKH